MQSYLEQYSLKCNGLEFVVFFLILDFSDRIALCRLLAAFRRFEKTSKMARCKVHIQRSRQESKKRKQEAGLAKFCLVGNEEFCRHTS